MTQWSVRGIQALTTAVSNLAWSIGCSGRSFQIVSSPIVFIPFLYSTFHFCLTHLESQSCNIIQTERDLKKILVQLLAQMSVNCSQTCCPELYLFRSWNSPKMQITQCVWAASPAAWLKVRTIPDLVYYHFLFYLFLHFFTLLPCNSMKILESPFRYWKGTSRHLQNLLFFQSNQAQLLQALLIEFFSSSDLGDCHLSHTVDVFFILQWIC